MKRAFMISVETPGANAPGLFTGMIGLDAQGRLAPQLVHRTEDSAEVIDAAWKAPSLAIANRVAALLIDHGDPAARITFVELVRAAAPAPEREA